MNRGRTLIRIAVVIFVGVGSAGCGRRAELEACDIAKSECQSDVFYAVMRMRGDGWDPFQGVPPIHTITVDRYKKQLEDEAKAAAKAAAEEAKKTKNQPAVTVPRVNPWDVTLQMLGLVTTQTTATQARIDDAANNVAAFYSSDVQKVTVLDRSQGAPQNPDRAGDTSLLAHELVHAFQDREHTLAQPSQTVDGSFADQVVVEGEAVLYQYLARVEIDGNVPQQIDWNSFYHRDWGDGFRRSFGSSTSPYYAVSWFVYPFGGDLMIRAWLRGGNAAIRRMNAEVPRNARELMAGYAGVASVVPDYFSCNPELPSDAYAFYARNRLGAMQLYALMAAPPESEKNPRAGSLEKGGDLSFAITNAQLAREKSAWQSGLDWRGDEIWLYLAEETQRVAFSWRIRSKNAAAADAIVAQESAKVFPMLQFTREGDADVRIVGSTDPDVVANWPGAVDCGN